jgi:hypothetical protein
MRTLGKLFNTMILGLLIPSLAFATFLGDPTTIKGGGTGLGTVPSAGQFLIGNSGGTAYALALMSGDATMAASGVLTLASSFAGKKTFTNGLDVGSNQITNVADPTTAQMAATKNYVDVAISNESVAKDAVNFATTAALAAVTYSNGSSGVGATLTEVAVGALSVDGGSPSVGQRILVKNQVSTLQNGVYVVTVAGSGIAAFVLTRSSDYNQASEALAGSSVFILSGTTNGSATWVQNSANVVTMGTDAITFAQTSGPGSVTAGTGITVTGSSVAITNTAVTPASYTLANFTVNQQGQLTAASSTSTPLTVAQTTVANQAISASAIDWSTGNSFTKTLAANTTFTFSNLSSGQTIIVRITNTASNFTVTWPTTSPVNVCWAGGATTCTGTQPVETVGAHVDVWTFYYDGTQIYASVIQNF